MNVTFDAMKLDIEDGLAVITLTEADRGNPIDDALCRDLRQVVLTIADSDARAVLLCAEGKAFGYGGDLQTFLPEVEHMAPMVRRLLSDFNPALIGLWRLPLPVVSAVQGYCMGASVALAAGADVVVVGEGTKFGAAFCKIGYSCDSGSSFTLAYRMGVARARRFQLMGEMLGAQEALATGLADFVVPDEEIRDTAKRIATDFANGATVALGNIKKLFAAAGGIMIEHQLQLEGELLAISAESDDAREGVKAMVAKRKANFTGK